MSGLGQLACVEQFHKQGHRPAYSALTRFVTTDGAQVFDTQPSRKAGLRETGPLADGFKRAGGHLIFSQKLADEESGFCRGNAAFKLQSDNAPEKLVIGWLCDERDNLVQNVFDLECVELECVGHFQSPYGGALPLAGDTFLCSCHLSVKRLYQLNDNNPRKIRRASCSRPKLERDCGIAGAISPTRSSTRQGNRPAHHSSTTGSAASIVWESARAAPRSDKVGQRPKDCSDMGRGSGRVADSRRANPARLHGLSDRSANRPVRSGSIPRSEVSQGGSPLSESSDPIQCREVGACRFARPRSARWFDPLVAFRTLTQSHSVRRKICRDSDGSGVADETRSGSAVGDSAGPTAIAHTVSGSSITTKGQV